MNVRPLWTCAFVAALLLSAAAPANAQKPITEEFIELILRAFAKETEETDALAPQLAEVDEKIRKFNECKELYDAAGDASGSRLGGLAARAAIRSKCGASNTEGFEKERQKILEGPEKSALAIAGLKAGDYRNLKSRLTSFFSGGGGFADAEGALLNARRADFAAALRMSFTSYAATGSGTGSRTGRSRPGFRTQWTSDYAWEYIGHMFEVMYISGATIFEKPYEPGQWTAWEIVARETRYDDDNRPDAELESKRHIERAFIGRTPEGNEWWRTTSIDFYDDNGTQKADTVVLESLFKPENEYVRQLVRVRAKLPGQDANELMVPQAFAMLSLLSVFPMKPTDESVAGATVGNERVGTFDARQVRFAAGSGGSIEWWLADDAPGGWVRFRHNEPTDEGIRQPGTYTIQMTGSGTGARSVLGVM